VSRVSIGLIGAGVMARRHAQVLGGLGATVAAVCDADRARADALAAESGADVFADWRAMLDGARLDAVLVERTLAPSRARAQSLVAAGMVEIDGETARSAARR